MFVTSKGCRRTIPPRTTSTGIPAQARWSLAPDSDCAALKRNCVSERPEGLHRAGAGLSDSRPIRSIGERARQGAGHRQDRARRVPGQREDAEDVGGRQETAADPWVEAVLLLGWSQRERVDAQCDHWQHQRPQAPKRMRQIVVPDGFGVRDLFVCQQTRGTYPCPPLMTPSTKP